MADLGILDFIGPRTDWVPYGGGPENYIVSPDSKGGLGTLHLPTQKWVPYVMGRGNGEELRKVVSGGPNPFIQAITSQPVSLALEAAGLGVGLLNLGVSAWTAWKLHGMSRKLDGVADGIEHLRQQGTVLEGLLAASTTHLDAMIRGNSLLLGLVLEQQAEVGQAIAVLRDELGRGFTSVHQAQARREAQELQEKLHSLFHYYQVCSFEMAQGRAPHADDLRRLAEIAIGVRSWLKVRLGDFAAGRPERLPLMVGWALTVSMEREAREQLDQAPDSVQQQLGQILTALGAELHVLVEKATLLDLAHDRKDLIEQYIFLARGLRGSATMIELPTGEIGVYHPASVLVWDDGLGEVRKIASEPDDGPLPERILLRSLADHRAWESIACLPTGCSQRHVDSRDCARVLGLRATQPAISEERVLRLIRVGPTALEDAKRRVLREASLN